ncbi:hypothetical protein [Flavobacterium silvaticum]|uniref:Uncharacterized protein n=1 Tax=Flavobacterium silvaticum TaxID=1852020 RepID=A0A972FNI3_9FLAO|nr:hypothetical protein [Flavobacterium silvaticum]NMH26494.1 hypothetical protein [Flavobacterium silvaticum]
MLGVIEFNGITISLIAHTRISLFLKVEYGQKTEYFEITDEILISLVELLLAEKYPELISSEQRKTLNYLRGLSGIVMSDRKSKEGLWGMIDANVKRGHGYFAGGEVIDQSTDVYIALPQKKISLQTIEGIQNACGDLMDALGFELEQKEEPVIGSFFQRLKFLFTSPKTKREAQDIYDKGKFALELAYLNMPNAEITEKLALASSNMMAQLEHVDEGVIRLGAIILVKYKTDVGNSRIIINTLSPQLTALFDSSPQLMNDPTTVFKMINNIQTLPNHFSNTDEPVSVSE